MKLNITEVQITCVVLMGLITLFLAKVFPTYTTAGKNIRTSCKFLTQGTLLVTIHFFIQYLLHKNFHDVAEIRTTINLLFGTPICYCFSLSYLYVMRQGNIKRREWWIGPIALIMTIGIALVDTTDWLQQLNLPHANFFMSFIYGAQLLFYRFLMFQSFLRVKKEMRTNEDAELSPLIEWTQWSLLMLVIVAFGFPFMTFCPNQTFRGIYGILAISSTFFYIISFTGYCLTNCAHPKSLRARVDEVSPAHNTMTGLTDENREEMDAIVQEFIDKESYTMSGITLKMAAIEMGVSCNRLRMWLRGTPYEKFNNWIVSLRIEKSKKLLVKHPALSNEEIAEQCGFCDRQYFQHQFSKKEGITPAKWLKERKMSFLASIQEKSSSKQE